MSVLATATRARVLSSSLRSASASMVSSIAASACNEVSFKTAPLFRTRPHHSGRCRICRAGKFAF